MEIVLSKRKDTLCGDRCLFYPVKPDSVTCLSKEQYAAGMSRINSQFHRQSNRSGMTMCFLAILFYGMMLYHSEIEDFKNFHELNWWVVYGVTTSIRNLT